MLWRAEICNAQKLKGTRMVILSCLQKRNADPGASETILVVCPKWQSEFVVFLSTKEHPKKDRRSALPAGCTGKTTGQWLLVRPSAHRTDPQGSSRRERAHSGQRSSNWSNVLLKDQQRSPCLPREAWDMSKLERFSPCQSGQQLYWTQEEIQQWRGSEKGNRRKGIWTGWQTLKLTWDSSPIPPLILTQPLASKSNFQNF